VITMGAGDQFSFYTRTAGPAPFPDRLQVRMSTNGASVNIGTTNTSVGDFNTMWIDINPTYSPGGYPSTWTRFTYTVPSAQAGTGRIAFRYFTTTGALPGENSAMIGIDDVVFAAVGGTTCSGTSITATVIVNPTATVNTVPNQTLCNGASTAAVNFSSPTTGGTIAYNWTNSNTAIGLAASGAGNIPSFTATNTGNAAISGTVTVTPVFTNTNLFSFINSTSIIIPVSGTVVASPYPSNIVVSGLPTSARLLAVRLHNMNHTAAGDLDIALRSPLGQTTILMSDVGGANSLSNTTITIDDLSALLIPNSVNPIPSGTYRCTNLAGALEPDIFPAPGPGALSQPNPSLSNFSNTSPNGQWVLMVVDQISGNGGAINGGFELIFGYSATCIGTPSTFTYTVNPSPTVTISSNIPPPILPGQIMVLTATVSPPGGIFAWYKDGVLIPGAANNTLGGITVANLGTYTVTYTDPNGCAVISAGFNVYAKPGNNLYVYPNPTTGSFSISFYNEPNEEITVALYDLSGMKVFYRKYITGSQRYSAVSIDHQLSNGNYYAEVRNAKNQVIGLKQISITR
ncbi:MAG: choice-of-anchor J domain-containing protein, partial [Bacteroidota bacterium]